MYNSLEETKKLRAIYKDLEIKVKELRDVVGRGDAGRYASLALTELESSRHWLGEVLGSLGQESPYKE